MIRNEPDPFQTILNNKVDKDMRPINKLTDLSIKQAVNKAKSSTKTITRTHERNLENQPA